MLRVPDDKRQQQTQVLKHVSPPWGDPPKSGATVPQVVAFGSSWALAKKCGSFFGSFCATGTTCVAFLRAKGFESVLDRGVASPSSPPVSWLCALDSFSDFSETPLVAS